MQVKINQEWVLLLEWDTENQVALRLVKRYEAYQQGRAKRTKA